MYKRQVTDNDSREKTGGAKVWRKEGLDNMIQKATFVKASETGGKSEVELWNAKGVKLGMATFVCVFLPFERHSKFHSWFRFGCVSALLQFLTKF